MALGIESPGPQCAFETSMFMCPAVHTTTRILLRPSSTHEPSDPPFRVVCSRYHNIYWGGVWRTGGRFRRCRLPRRPRSGLLYDLRARPAAADSARVRGAGAGARRPRGTTPAAAFYAHVRLLFCLVLLCTGRSREETPARRPRGTTPASAASAHCTGKPGVAADAGPVAFGRHCRARRLRAGSTAPVLAPRNSLRFSRRAARADDRADAYRPTLGRAPLECRYAATALCLPAAAECGTPPTDPVDT